MIEAKKLFSSTYLLLQYFHPSTARMGLAFNPEPNRVTNVIPFKRRKLSEKHKGKSLCREGFHKWEVDKASVFDVKQGCLVTRYRCSRCGVTRTKAT